MSLVGLGHSEDAAAAEAESGQEVGEKVKGQWRQEGDLLATAPSRRHPSGPPRGGGSHLSTLPGPQRPVMAPIGPLRPPGPWPASPRPGPPLRPFTEPGMVPTRRWLTEAPAPPADLGLFWGSQRSGLPHFPRAGGGDPRHRGRVEGEPFKTCLRCAMPQRWAKM